MVTSMFEARVVKKFTIRLILEFLRHKILGHCTMQPLFPRQRSLSISGPISYNDVLYPAAAAAKMAPQQSRDEDVPRRSRPRPRPRRRRLRSMGRCSRGATCSSFWPICV